MFEDDSCGWVVLFGFVGVRILLSVFDSRSLLGTILRGLRQGLLIHWSMDSSPMYALVTA